VFLALLGLHAILAAVAPLAARRMGRAVLLLCALAPAATVVAAVVAAAGGAAGQPVRESFGWAPAIGLTVDLRLDGFALLMVALVSGIGVLVFGYAAAYFPQRHDIGRFAGYLTAFAGSMLGLVLADNLLLLYVFWEGTSVTSYLLIGFDDRKGSARAAALHAILVTSAGGLAMLAGFVVLGQVAGTYSLSGLLADPPSGPAVSAGLLLALAGAVTKSAQVPFHMWLPAAMAAPTPVSAYLHSATLVKAGVYLIARLAPAFALVPFWRPVVVTIGVATMIFGGLRALRQDDLKLLLAFGTVSQLGFLVAVLGAGTPQATLAGAALLLAHGLFKASLFMVTGVIDRQTGTRDLRLLSGLGRRMPALAVVGVVAAASMAGLPPLVGFVAKEAVFEAYLHGGMGPVGPLALAGLVVGSILTVAYSARFVRGAFATQAHPSQRCVGSQAPLPSRAFQAPAALLALASLVAGLLPMLIGPLVSSAGSALDPNVEVESLSLWHGLTPALGLSALVVALGAVLVLAGGRVAAVQQRFGGWSGADDAYVATLRGLNRTADRVTGFAQNGSLPVYLSVILLTVVTLSGTALLSGGMFPSPAFAELVLAESLLHLVTCLAVILTAFATLVAGRRLVAVLCLGGVGYGVAVLFVLQGAPDLALTQLLIETLAIVVFVLVLRHLPEEFEPHRWRFGQKTRWLVAGSVGLFVFIFALVASAARTAAPISEGFLARALPEGGGRNIVNVILVDFRGFDTFGEITVLATAALGIIGLVRAVRAGPGTPPQAEGGS